MNEKAKKILLGIGVVVFLVVFVVWMWSSDLEHIEDLNGEDNYSLTTITEEQIKEHTMGYLNLKKSKGILSGNFIEFSSDKFTGVCEVFSQNMILNSDFVLDVTNFVIEEGNFEMVLLLDGEIVTRLEPDTFVTYQMEKVNGRVSLVIAGESAKFSFSIDGEYYGIEMEE